MASRLLLLALALPLAALAQQIEREYASFSRDAHGKALWRISAVSMAAGHTLDSVSSIGMREWNPLLRSPNGEFGSRGVAIKGGIVVGAILLQSIVLKRTPPNHWAHRAFTIINFSNAGTTAYIAARNWQRR